MRKATPRNGITDHGDQDTKTDNTFRVGITESSGNVFADVGLPNPQREMIKARLTLRLRHIIRDRGLTQSQAARSLGIKTATRVPPYAQPAA